MSKIVANMQKFKMDNLGGLSRHNERKTDGHKNEQIDNSRSWQNYDLGQRQKDVSLQSDIKDYIAKNRVGTKAVRKDAVAVAEWVISSDSDFFKNLSPAETRNFFKAAVDYFGKKFGEENIRYGIVHMDETTPHMHMGIVPLTEDGRLTAKAMFDRQALQDVQNDLPEFLRERGFDIERGELGSERKHMSIPEYKQTKDKLSSMTQELTNKSRELDKLNNTLEATEANLTHLRRFQSGSELSQDFMSDFRTLERGANFPDELQQEINSLASRVKESKFNKDNLIIPKSDFQKLLELPKKSFDFGFDSAYKLVKRAFNKIINWVNDLFKAFKKLQSERDEMKFEIHQNKKEISQLEAENSEMVDVETWNATLDAFERETGRPLTEQDLIKQNRSKSYGDLEI